MTSQRTRDYELVMILSPEATESEAAATARRISALITDGGGSVSHQEHWGVRRLAYPIQRFVEGNYFITRCAMDAGAANDLDKTLNAAQDVLRHLIFKLEKSEIAAIEAQTARERQAKEREEARQAAERQARERDDARQSADARASEEARAPQPAAPPPPQAASETAAPPADVVDAAPSSAASETPPQAAETAETPSA